MLSKPGKDEMFEKKWSEILEKATDSSFDPHWDEIFKDCLYSRRHQELLMAEFYKLRYKL